MIIIGVVVFLTFFLALALVKSGKCQDDVTDVPERRTQNQPSVDTEKKDMCDEAKDGGDSRKLRLKAYKMIMVNDAGETNNRCFYPVESVDEYIQTYSKAHEHTESILRARIDSLYGRYLKLAEEVSEIRKEEDTYRKFKNLLSFYDMLDRDGFWEPFDEYEEQRKSE